MKKGYVIQIDEGGLDLRLTVTQLVSPATVVVLVDDQVIPGGSYPEALSLAKEAIYAERDRLFKTTGKSGLP